MAEPAQQIGRDLGNGSAAQNPDERREFLAWGGMVDDVDQPAGVDARERGKNGIPVFRAGFSVEAVGRARVPSGQQSGVEGLFSEPRQPGERFGTRPFIPLKGFIANLLQRGRQSGIHAPIMGPDPSILKRRSPDPFRAHYNHLMRCLLLLLALQTDPAQEAAELIRKLGSDVLEERDQATAQLKKLGPAVAPALLEALKTGEAEVRERARDILAEFERRARVQAFRPSDRRISVRLDQVPLSDAVTQLLHPFGMTGAKVTPEAAERTVTLKIKEGSFWEVLEQLEGQAKVRVNLSSGRIDPDSGEPSRRFGTGDVRFTVDGWGGRSGGKGPTYKALFPKVWLSPGAWACVADLDDVVVTDEAGNPIEAQWYDGLETVRKQGLPSGVDLGTLAILPENLKGKKTVTLRATLRLGYARDLERSVMEPVPGKMKLGRAGLEIDKLSKDPAKEWWDLSLSLEGGGEAGTTLLSVEDAAGRWMGDLMTLAVRPRSSMSTSRGAYLQPGAPARCIVHRAVGADTFEVPYSVTIAAPP